MKYRTEELWGEGYRDAAAVMSHEVFELQNTDILDTLSSTILKGTEIGNKLAKLSTAISNDESDDMGAMLDEYYEDEELGKQYFQNVLEEIKKITGKEINYCLWLCDSPQNIIDEYDHNRELQGEFYTTYEESDVVLSDIGSGGKLYGYTELPKPVTF